MLPLIVWGKFRNERDYMGELEKKTGTGTFPSTPGVFSLRPPYETTIIVMDKRCPAQFVNDARGVKKQSYNIHFVQHEKPRDLVCKMKGLQ